METKRCSKCGEVKAVDGFYRDKRGKGGIAPQCIACRKEYVAAHRAMYSAVTMRWKREHPERVRSYRIKSREADIARSRKWWKENTAAIREYRNVYRKSDASRASKKASYARNAPLLPDYAIKASLRRMMECVVGSAIPPELIEAKRAHLQMVRILKKEKQK